MSEPQQEQQLSSHQKPWRAEGQWDDIFIQSNGNKIFGITAYAQPILAIISTLLSVIAVFYVRKFLIKKD